MTGGPARGRADPPSGKILEPHHVTKWEPGLVHPGFYYSIIIGVRVETPFRPVIHPVYQTRALFCQPGLGGWFGLVWVGSGVVF